MINTQFKFMGRLHNASKTKTFEKSNYEWIYDGDSIFNFIGANGITFDDVKEAYQLGFIKELDYSFLYKIWGHDISSRKIVVLEQILDQIKQGQRIINNG